MYGLHSNAHAEILYTNAGFVPDSIEVSVGTRITFRNTTDTPMWPASDPHPTHTDYPEFDADRSYGRGETYTFVFQKAGTWGFHNHERSIDRGVVHVVDASAAELDIDKTKPDQRAERDRLLAMLDPHNVDSIFNVVDTIQASSTLSVNCHDIAHDLGHRAYELYGFSEAMTFNNPKHLNHTLVEYICAGGYMHGIVEEMFLRQPEFKSDLDVVCAGVDEKDRASCYHGIGHALMFIENRDVHAALSDCRHVKESGYTYRCFEGVWMEFFWGSTEHAGPNSLGWDMQTPLDPCIAAQKDEKPTCFLYAPFGYLRSHPKDYDGAVQLCTESELSQSDKDFCLKGLGITMMSKFKGQHLEKSAAYVADLPSEQRRFFYEGVLGYATLSGVQKSKLEKTCSLFTYDYALCLAVLRQVK